MKGRIGRRRFVACGLCSSMTLAAPASAHDQSTGSKRSNASRSLSDKLTGYLRSQQQADGSWRSEQYGVLRGGQALTPWVLLALIDSGAVGADSKCARQGIQWMLTQVRDGALGLADPDVLEYPVYATSLALRCLTRVLNGSTQTRELTECRDSMVKFLLREQFTARRGFRESDLAFGGWGFGGKQPSGMTGHMDLAHTRIALQALRDAKTDASADPSDATMLLRLLQKHPSDLRVQPVDSQEDATGAPYDGGFYFSPIVLKANKGRVERSQGRTFFRSYATATCDGILALLAAGVALNDARVRAAARWLETHPDWEYPFGIPKDYPEPWADAVYFYHQAVRAETYQRLGIACDWQAKLLPRLDAHLRSDGSIVNRRSALMKEDDPILCTTLALFATNAAQDSS